MKETHELIRSCCEGISYIPEIKKILPSDEALKDMTGIFKALNDPMRMKILFALLKYEICVGELVNLLEIPQSHVSHQLRILRKYDIVTYQKDKKMSFYRIKNDAVKTILNTALEHLKCQKKL